MDADPDRAGRPVPDETAAFLAGPPAAHRAAATPSTSGRPPLPHRSHQGPRSRTRGRRRGRRVTAGRARAVDQMASGYMYWFAAPVYRYASIGAPTLRLSSYTSAARLAS